VTIAGAAIMLVGILIGFWLGRIWDRIDDDDDDLYN
jgi:hypothetical protein